MSNEQCAKRDIRLNRIIRIDEVMSLAGVGRSTIYKWINDGMFPKGVKLGPRAVGWPESVIAEWIEQRTQC